MSQEILERAMSLRAESEEIERQLQFVSEQITDLESFRDNLKLLEENPDEEILANIGRGVHMKVNRKKDERLFVEVGAGTLVRKTPKETEKIISEQIAKFKEAKVRLHSQLQEYVAQFQTMMSEIESLRK